MTSIEFKKAIRDTWTDFDYYLKAIFFFLGGLCISFSLVNGSLDKFGQKMFLTLSSVILLCVLFALAFFILWFVPKTHNIQSVITGKSLKENEDLIKTLITLYDTDGVIHKGNFFSFFTQARKPNWLDHFLVMNNYALVSMLASDSLIEINVQPRGRDTMYQPAGNLKMANRIRSKIVESIKNQI